MPSHSPTSIRNAVRAVVIHEGRLLAVKMQDRDGIFHILPGGGQHAGETFHDTLRRECMEELGAQIRIGEFLFVREYIGRNHGFRHRHANFHQVETVFRCTIDDLSTIRVGDEHDMRQVGVTWIPLADLEKARFFPKILASFVVGDDIVVTRPYLGDVN